VTLDSEINDRGTADWNHCIYQRQRQIVQMRKRAEEAGDSWSHVALVNIVTRPAGAVNIVVLLSSGHCIISLLSSCLYGPLRISMGCFSSKCYSRDPSRRRPVTCTDFCVCWSGPEARPTPAKAVSLYHIVSLAAVLIVAFSHGAKTTCRFWII